LERGEHMVMTAKNIEQKIAPPSIWPETATDESRKEINKLVKEFLNAFEADYRQKIEGRKKK
jgi:hypothetical protein